MSDELNVLAGAYALDALDEDERAVFEEHLATCVECAEEVRGMQLTAAELSHTTAAAPPPQLRADVLSSISRVRPLPPVVDNVVALHRARAARSTWQVLAAACAMIAIIVSAWGYSQHRAAERASSASTSRISALSTLLSAPDVHTSTTNLSQGAGTVVYSKSQHRLVLIGHDLPVPASGKTYQLWMLPQSGSAAISGGTFRPNSAGEVELPVSGDLAGVGKMAISVEPAGGSSQPTPGTVQQLKL